MKARGGAAPHPAVGECGVAALRVELQRDEGHLRENPGHHGLNRLILRDAHVLERPRQESHPIWGGVHVRTCGFDQQAR